MSTFARTLQGALRRVFPACVIPAQAVAFNMFLAFFPMLLFVFGILGSSDWLKEEVAELPNRLRLILPPGSERVVLNYLVRRGAHPGGWIWLGLGGTLLAGTQVMMALMQGFRVVAGDPVSGSIWTRQLRALLLLCLIIAPWLAVVVLTVFGKEARGWLIQEIGLAHLVLRLGTLFYFAFALVLGLAVLTLIYRVGRPAQVGWRGLLPGAALATLLWWVVDAGFGFYVGHMPYGAVYGGLAAAIGLLLWMYMTAIIVFLGAAYNAESSRSEIAIRETS
jgi:membrane protein